MYESWFIIRVRFDNRRDGAVIIIKRSAARRVGGQSNVIVLGQFEFVPQSWYFDADQKVDYHHATDNNPIRLEWLVWEVMKRSASYDVHTTRERSIVQAGLTSSEVI
jgi:hypothetical protein